MQEILEIEQMAISLLKSLSNVVKTQLEAYSQTTREFQQQSSLYIRIITPSVSIKV